MDIRKKINWKKIILFIGFAFLFSWSISLLIYFLDISIKTPIGLLIIAFGYMLGPSLSAIIVQKFIYKSSLKKYGLKFSFNKHFLISWFKTSLIFVLMIGVIFLIIYILGNKFNFESFGYLDFSQKKFNENFLKLISNYESIDNLPKIPELPSKLMFFVFVIQAILIGSIFNFPVAFLEEFGWRGFLLSETRNIGFLKSSFFIGLIWGLWHLPLILLGYNYSSASFYSVFMICMVTISISPIFSYLFYKSKSIIITSTFHGMINAIGVIFLLYVNEGDIYYNSIIGWSGILTNFIIILIIFIKEKNIQNIK